MAGGAAMDGRRVLYVFYSFGEPDMRSVAIAGFARDTRELVNAEPPEVEIWGLNLASHFLKRWNRWYQLHPPDWRGKEVGEEGYYGRDPEHLHFLQTCDALVYMNFPDDRIPTATQFPLAEVTKAIGRPYFTSSMAYILGHAIYEGVDEIKLFGVNLSSHAEYLSQRAGVEYLLGVAEGRGIKVFLPPGCPLLQAPLYAIHRDDVRQMAQERLDQWKARYMEEWASYAATYGAFYQARKYDDEAEISRLRRKLGQHQADLNACQGGIREAQHWLATLGGADLHMADLPKLESPKGLEEPEPEIVR